MSSRAGFPTARRTKNSASAGWSPAPHAARRRWTRRSWRRPWWAAIARATAAPGGTLLDAKRREARSLVARLRQEIEANTDDVGAKFPEVARAMHAGDEPERAIRGQASPHDARALIEEGVAVMPIPALADELN